MNTILLESKGTGVRLAKSIRVITKQIMECEEERLAVISSKIYDASTKSEVLISLAKEIDVKLIRRTFLIESLIGYLSHDNFTANYISISNRNDIDDRATLPVSANMKVCKTVYTKKVIDDAKSQNV